MHSDRYKKGYVCLNGKGGTGFLNVLCIHQHNITNVNLLLVKLSVTIQVHSLLMNVRFQITKSVIYRLFILVTSPLSDGVVWFVNLFRT